MSSFQAMAAHMWSPPKEPHIFGAVDVEMTRTLDYMERYSKKHGVKITVTHLCIAAVARLLKSHPEANMKCQGAKFYQRENIDIFVLVSIPGGKDLAGVMLRDCDELSLADIADRLRGDAGKVKGGKDKTYGKSRNMFERYPAWLTGIILKFADFYINRLNGDLSGFGMPRDPFGSALVTSVGMFGVEEAWAPFVPFGRAPILLLITKIRDKPVVEGGKVVVRPVMKLCATIDHRILDGFKAAQLASELKDVMSNPEEAFGLDKKVPVGHGVE